MSVSTVLKHLRVETYILSLYLLSHKERDVSIIFDAHSIGRPRAKATVAAVKFLISSAVRYHVTAAVFNNELQQLGLPKEHSNVICSKFEEYFNALRKRHFKVCHLIFIITIGRPFIFGSKSVYMFKQYNQSEILTGLDSNKTLLFIKCLIIHGQLLNYEQRLQVTLRQTQLDDIHLEEGATEGYTNIQLTTNYEICKGIVQDKRQHKLTIRNEDLESLVSELEIARKLMKEYL